MYVICCNVYVRTSWVQIAATIALLSDKIIVGANTASAVQVSLASCLMLILSNQHCYIGHSAAFVAQRISFSR